MASAKFTIGSVLTAASESAAVVTSTMTTINASVSMAHAFVAKAQRQQAVRYAMEELDTTQRLAEELAMEASQREVAIKAYCGDDEAKQETFNKHLDRFLAVANKA